MLAGAREGASTGACRFIPRNHRAGYKYLLRASLPLLFDVLLLFTSNPLLLLLFLSSLLSPLLLRLFMSCSAEASQKEDGKKVGDPWKKVGDPGKKVGDPRRAEAPWVGAPFPSPSMVPCQQHRMGKNSALTSHRRGARQPASCIPGAFCSNSTQPLARHFPPPG